MRRSKEKIRLNISNLPQDVMEYFQYFHNQLHSVPASSSSKLNLSLHLSSGRPGILVPVVQ